MRHIAVAVFVTLAAAGCGNASDVTNYDSIDALGDAYAAAGGSCTDLVVQYRASDEDPEVASCGESTELTVANDTAQAQELAAGYMLRGTPVLTEGNWLIADADIASLQAKLGGRVLQLEAAAGPANLADGLLVDADGVVRRDGVATGATPQAVDRDAPVLTVVVDPLCEYCANFWQSNADTIAERVGDGDVELDLHLVALDDSVENGYASSFAVNAFACVAAGEPAKALDFVGAIFDAQNDEGWSLEELAAIAKNAGAGDAVDCVTAGDYLYWTRQSTQRALETPFPDGDALRGVPTVLLDDRLFDGDVRDAAAFESFLAG